MGRVIQFEISSQDAARHSQFYADVFGWKMSEPNWGYYPAKTGPTEEAGIDGGIAQGPENFPLGVRLQIQVESIQESIAKALANGGKVVQDVMDFGSFKLAYLMDPLGVQYGLIEQQSET